jgi:hypothetical protein
VVPLCCLLWGAAVGWRCGLAQVSSTEQVPFLCRAWLDKERLQSIEWLLPTTNTTDETMPASTQQQFNSAVKLSESMLRSLKRNDGLQGPLKAQLFEGADPVGACRAECMLRAAPPVSCCVQVVPCIRRRLCALEQPLWWHHALCASQRRWRAELIDRLMRITARVMAIHAHSVGAHA